MSDERDLGMCVGVDGYPWPHDFIEEAKTQGVSKQISKASVPYIVPGETRLALIHPRAIPMVTTPGMTLLDLATELTLDFENPPDAPSFFDEDQEFPLAKFAFYLRARDRDGTFVECEKKYGLEFEKGWVGYTYVTGTQYVLQNGETELPEELRGMGIEPVRITYEDGEEDNDVVC